MKSFILAFLFALLQLISTAQSVKDYVLNNTVIVNSVSMNDTSDADLLPIAQAIGNSRIVLLGEQDHGDAPTFLAKGRLIKYLHEKMGFDVLAFESDFYGMTRSWEEYKKGKLTFNESIGNIFGLWTFCDVNKDLFSYISKSQNTLNPLLLTGFDNQLHGPFRALHYKEDFLSYLKSNSAPEHFSVELSHLLDLIQTTYPLGYNNSVPQDSMLHYQKLLDSLIEWNKKLSPDNFLTILTTSLKNYVEQSLLYNKNDFESLNVRDRQMAANLKWISQYYYPGKKIIVWAHNYHVAKNTWDAMGPKSGKHISMGHVLFQELGKEMYILGFDSYEGNAGRLGGQQFNLKKPKKNSLEQWFAKKNSEYAFVDFRKFPADKKELFYMKGKSHKSQLARWNEVFDGVFYVRHMYACEPLK
jgi:erythromycin esterase